MACFQGIPLHKNRLGATLTVKLDEMVGVFTFELFSDEDCQREAALEELELHLHERFLLHPR